MRVFRPIEFLKATHKYLKRWRGSDGNWRYLYEDGRVGKTRDTVYAHTGTLAGVTKEDVKNILKRFHRREPGKGIEKTVLDMGELQVILQNTTFCMISAGRNPEDPEDAKLTKAEVKTRHKALVADLKAEGYVFSQTRGKYGSSEESAMVMTHDADRESLMELGAKYKQDSILFTSKGHSSLIFTSGPNKGKPDMAGDGYGFVPDAKNYYTKIPLGDGSNIKFSMNLGDVVKAFLYSAISLLKAKRQSSAAARRWRDGKLHRKVAGKWVVVSEGRTKAVPKKKIVKKPSTIKAPEKTTLRGLNDYIRTKYGRDIEIKKKGGYLFFSLTGLRPGKYPLPIEGTLGGRSQGEWEQRIDQSFEQAGMSPMGMKEAIQSILVPPISDHVPEPVKINAKTRAKLNRAVGEAVSDNYYDAIPLADINEALKSEGYILIQEDNTEWAGMLLGAEGEAFFNIGELSTVVNLNGLNAYAEVANSGLRMTWYEMRSGRYEIVKYVT